MKIMLARLDVPRNRAGLPSESIFCFCFTGVYPVNPVKKPYLRNQREACCHKMFVKREHLSNSVLFHDNKAHRICITKILILILS